MLRYVSFRMRNPLVLGRDFMKLAKLTLRSDDVADDKENVETYDIMNIEPDAKDLRTTSQDMRINPH